MRYSIIVIGDELLIGQVTDTNSGWMERELLKHGWRVENVRIIGDTQHAIVSAIDSAFAETDVVLMTGGLGPTRDDITKATLCGYFGGEMRLDADVSRQVNREFAKRGIAMNDLTAAQACVPSSCQVIPNEVGTAPIMWFERGGKVLVSMPGVPFEMKYGMSHYVIPRLLSHFQSDVYIEHRTLVTLSVPESELATRLAAFEDALPNFVNLAYLPDQGIVRLRLTGEHPNRATLLSTLDELEQKLDDLLGTVIACHGDKPIAKIVGDALTQKGLTIATAESCTGGNIAHQITRVAGSSGYFKGSVVAYSNEVKRRVLGVDADALDRHGAVSEPVVRQMSDGVAGLLGSDCAVATSGIAGPGGGTDEKPVGTVWIAATVGKTTVAKRYQFGGDRERVITRATNMALTMLLQLLL